MDRIKALPRGVAHTVLLAICNEPSTLARAIDLIDLLQAPQSPADEYDEDEVEIVGVAPMPNRKRKTPPGASVAAAADLFNCERCQRPFFASRNRHDACKYHEGELEPDLECGIWDDHTTDPDTWGPIDTPENIQEHPEGFYWDCCGKRADDAGCQIDYHVSTEFSENGGAKRSRLDGAVNGGQGAYAKDAIDVRDDGDEDDEDGDSVVEVAAPLVTIDDDIDEDPPEELEDEVEFGAAAGNGQAVVGAAVYQEVKTVVAASDDGFQETYSGLEAKGEPITHAQEL